MRSIWKGHIRFSLVTIPIQVYSAIESEESISFNQLHKDDSGRIGYDKKCKKCGKSVSLSDIVKGYEYSPDQYVVIEPDDLTKVKLKSTKVIEIEGFVDSPEINPMLYDAPYFIGPDGNVAGQAYQLLLKTLQESHKLGVGKVVIRDREDIVAISPHQNGLVMFKLRYPAELRSIKDVPQLDGQQNIDKDQVKLARTLVDTMSISLKDIEMKDRYKEAVRELIQAKLDGKEIKPVKEDVPPVTDIMKALKKSLEQAKKQKLPMEKAKGKAAEPVKTAAKGKKKKTA